MLCTCNASYSWWLKHLFNDQHQNILLARNEHHHSIVPMHLAFLILGKASPKVHMHFKYNISTSHYKLVRDFSLSIYLVTSCLLFIYTKEWCFIFHDDQCIKNNNNTIIQWLTLQSMCCEKNFTITIQGHLV